MGKEILRLRVGDVARMKKKHPCGSDLFSILRVGGEIRAVCLGCGRDLTMDRVRFEKAVASITPSAKETEGDES